MHPNGRIYIARSVKFNENEYPYTTLFPNTKSEAPSPTNYTYIGDYTIPQLSVSFSSLVDQFTS